MLETSVVLATYNGAQFLPLQLDSIARQRKLPLELIVSDDNSSDTTADIVREFTARAPFPVKFFSNVPGLGFRDNFLTACDHASGEWISFCDQDDVWREDKLEICTRYMQDARVSQIVHIANLIDEKGQQIGDFRQGIVRSGLRPPLHYDVWSTFWGFSIVFRRSLLQLLPKEERFVDYIDAGHLIAHDRWVHFLAQSLGDTVEVAETLVDYRQHGDNLFGSPKAKRRPKSRSRDLELNKTYIEATERMLEIVSNLPKDTEAMFPAFDRAAAIKVYERAFQQVSNRAKIYECSRMSGLFRIIVLMTSGGYRDARGVSTRWRSLLKDLLNLSQPTI